MAVYVSLQSRAHHAHPWVAVEAHHHVFVTIEFASGFGEVNNGRMQKVMLSSSVPAARGTLFHHPPHLPCLPPFIVPLLMFSRVFRTFSSSTRVCHRNFTTTSLLRRPIDMEKVDTTDRLKRLRELMTQHKVDIYSTLYHYP
jgi:hypothetical protein